MKTTAAYVLLAILAGTSGSGTAVAAPPEGASTQDIAFANSLSKAFKSVAKGAEPAVVHIIALSRRQNVRYDWFGTPVEVGPMQMMPMSQGSGFIIDENGTAVTNNHVVEGADELRVRLLDGRELPAKVVGRDEGTDLAVIHIDAGDSPLKVRPLSLGNSELLDVGEWVVAIGSPFGFSNTVTAGIVSAKGRSLTPRETGRTFEDYIQTDAAINPGNSGGPLLNLQGEVVGVNSAIASRSGGFQGLGFAIPSNLTRAVVENIIANGRVVRGWLGVAFQPETGGDTGDGVLVTRVIADSPAEHAGLHEGDRITRFQGQALNEARLRTAIAIQRPGSKAEMDVERDGKLVKVTAEIGDYARSLAAQGQAYLNTLGLTVESMSLEDGRQRGYRNIRGALVVSVEPDGPAAASGLQEGDIIVQVDNQAVTSAQTLALLDSQSRIGHGTRMGVVRGNRQGFLNVP